VSLYALLQDARTIAVLGATGTRHKAAHYVPAYLAEQGFRVLPVNAVKVGTELFGQPVVGALTDLTEPVDLVDVFRRSELLVEHEAEILAMDPLPRVVWFQQGIRDDALAARLEAAGITVVQDACTLAVHRAHSA
jgi:predicted CoA-binding protein